MRYRTSPIGALSTHFTGGFYHDGRFADLNAVVNHYDKCMNLKRLVFRGLTMAVVSALLGVLDAHPYNTSKPGSDLHEGVVRFCEDLLVGFTINIRRVVDIFSFGHNPAKNLIGIE
jgi:hypothetical protein